MDAATAPPSGHPKQMALSRPTTSVNSKPYKPQADEMYPNECLELEVAVAMARRRKMEQKAEEAAKEAKELERQKYVAEKKQARQKYAAEKMASARQLLRACCPFIRTKTPRRELGKQSDTGSVAHM